MLVVLEQVRVGAEGVVAERRVDERHRGQRAGRCAGDGEELGHRKRVSQIEAAEDRCGRQVGEIVLPGDAGAVQQVEDGSGERLVPARRRREGRDDLGRRHVPEGGRRQCVGAIGKGRSDHRREIPIADREGLRQPVVEGQIVVVVEGHGVVRQALRVGLQGGVVDAHESVVRTLAQRIRGMVEVRLLVTARPPVVQIRAGAIIRLSKWRGVGVEGEDLRLAAQRQGRTRWPPRRRCSSVRR